MGRTFSIKTLGCKLNQYETSLIATHFLKGGWELFPFGEKVDLVIINTCTVTDRSDKKCRNYIRQGAIYSYHGGVVVTGCLVQRDPDGIDRMPEVLATFGNVEKDKIFDSIEEIFRGIDYSQQDFKNNLSVIDENMKIGLERKSQSTISSPIDISSDLITRGDEYRIDAPLPLFHSRAYIKIQDGCDGVCTYCIVPSVRGVPKSRSTSEILEHSRRLIDAGFSELILTGVTIGSYNYNNIGLSDLLGLILGIEGVFRVRLSSIEPNHISEKLIGLFENDKVCPHIHLPVQSGADKILNKMKRPYIVRDYLKVIEKIKKRVPDLAIGTDIIIGFPGETEEDFQCSMKLIEQVGYSYVHQFTFSPRSGTPASEIKSICSSIELSERGKRMRNLSKVVGVKYRKRFEQKILASIIEKNRNNEGYSAVSDNYIKIAINGSIDNQEVLGMIVDVLLLNVSVDKNIGDLVST